MTCTVEDCDNPVLVKKAGLCRMHYYRLRRTGTTDLIDRKTYCTIEGCDEQSHGNGLCPKHWARNARNGDPSVRLRARDDGPDETRWMQKVSVESPGCWIWTAGMDGNGYGSYSVGGKSIRIHQYVWTLLVGPVDDGFELDHLCRVRNCCNPDHLEAVTHRINVKRGVMGKAGRPGTPRPRKKRSTR